MKASVKKSVICIFQPHRYTRTEEFLKDFSKSFSFADKVIITNIFAANEENINNVSGKDIVDLMKKDKHKSVRYIENKFDAVNILAEESSVGDSLFNGCWRHSYDFGTSSRCT